MPSRNLFVIMAAMFVSAACYAKAERSRYVAGLAEAMSLIEDDFVEPVDSRALFEGAMNGMVETLGDPHSNFIPLDDFTQFQEDLGQEFGGVGILVEANPVAGTLTVMTPLVNTPAWKAGIQAGDEIVQIDGKPTRDMKMGEAVTVMRGKPGTSVALVIRRAGEAKPLELQVAREVIPVESVLGDTRREDGSWNFFLEDHPQIGYLRVTTFGDHTADELEKALVQYKEHPVEALVLDLRDNGGGYLSAAVEISDMFIDQGRIVSTRGRDGIVRTPYDAEPSNDLFPHDKPMVVLVNGETASASEIVAACLQDHGRAAVVGARSYGKGTVQNVFEMEAGKSALKLTTASYWRPSGKNINRTKDAGEEGDWGVSPNPGCDVSLDVAALDKLRRLRQWRDIVLRPGQARPPFESLAAAPPLPETSEGDGDATAQNASGANSSAASNSSRPALSRQAEAIAAWSDDPQLRRAIDYLHTRLQRRDAPAHAKTTPKGT